MKLSILFSQMLLINCGKHGNGSNCGQPTTGGGGGGVAPSDDVRFTRVFQLPSQPQHRKKEGSCIPHSEREILHLTSMVTDATPVSRGAFCGDGV